MARSFKHYPCIKEHSRGGTKYVKRFASKIIRNLPLQVSIENGGAYKKFYESWFIHDYRFIPSFNKFTFDSQRYTMTYDNYD